MNDHDLHAGGDDDPYFAAIADDESRDDTLILDDVTTRDYAQLAALRAEMNKRQPINLRFRSIKRGKPTPVRDSDIEPLPFDATADEATP